MTSGTGLADAHGDIAANEVGDDASDSNNDGDYGWTEADQIEIEMERSHRPRPALRPADVETL